MSSLIYRYVRVFDAIQRQQTRWFVYTVAVGFCLSVLWTVLTSLTPTDSPFQLFSGMVNLVSAAFIPLGLGIAILRYRLWDIVVIINRTLVDGSLTVLLVGLYVGLILALQALMRAVTGSLSQSPLVIVVSTLVIAALFQPLRHWLQNSIDRRFYRRKYDAAKVLAAFSATLRQEVDLEQLREQLVAVVQETMQPAHLSLWLRQPKRAESSSFQASKPLPERAGGQEEIARHERRVLSPLNVAVPPFNPVPIRYI